jgi:hypothetical protein
MDRSESNQAPPRPEPVPIIEPVIPIVPKRPSIHVANSPVIPSRPSAPSKPVVPERPTSEVSKPVIPDRPNTEMPNMLNARLWTDKSGTFKVTAEYLSVSDNKVHLHKTNGVKIAVPLDKLDAKDIEYLATLPGNAYLSTKPTATSAPAIPVIPARPSISKSSKVDESIIAEAAAIKPAPIAGVFTHNGFNWREWLLAAGVSPGDASNYAEKFVAEKLDGKNVADLQRDLLRSLGVTEGDILRIRKSAGDDKLSQLPTAAQALLANKEKAAQERNMALLSKVKSLFF